MSGIYRFTLQKSVEHEPSIGQLVPRERMRLLDASRVRHARLAQIREQHIVAAAVCTAERVHRAWKRWALVGLAVAVCRIHVAVAPNGMVDFGAANIRKALSMKCGLTFPFERMK